MRMSAKVSANTTTVDVRRRCSPLPNYSGHLLGRIVVLFIAMRPNTRPESVYVQHIRTETCMDIAIRYDTKSY